MVGTTVCHRTVVNRSGANGRRRRWQIGRIAGRSRKGAVPSLPKEGRPPTVLRVGEQHIVPAVPNDQVALAIRGRRSNRPWRPCSRKSAPSRLLLNSGAQEMVSAR